MTDIDTSGKTSKKEKAYEKYAWVLLLIPSFVLLIFSIQGLIYGYTNMAPSNLVSAGVSASTPSATIVLLNYLARLNAWSTISLMAFVIFVAATTFRKGRPWAWYAILWVFVTAIIANELEIINGGSYQNSDLTGFLIFTLPVILGLLLPVRRFFPKRQRLT